MTKHDPMCIANGADCICEFLILAESRGYDAALADTIKKDHGKGDSEEHDPFCPDYEIEPCDDKNCYACNACECDLIASVREDERKKLNTKIAQVLWEERHDGA